MDPFIPDGQHILILKGYYRCHPIRRGDIVAYNYGGMKGPLIKIIQALPGDRMSFREVPQIHGWNILINNSLLRNMEGTPYLIGTLGFKMLSLYIYKGKIRPDAYLLLGNQVGGSLDSTRFGLVGSQGIIGKVELPAAPQPADKSAATR